MPGPRQPTDLILLAGKKHLSRSEEADRRSRECRVPSVKNPKPPPWLDESLRKEFRKLGKTLCSVGLYSDLDADILGMYLTHRHQWELATRELEAALQIRDCRDSDVWSKVQERSFRAASSCASKLGLSVSDRCRLLIPQPVLEQEDAVEDPFMAQLLARQRSLGEQ